MRQFNCNTAVNFISADGFLREGETPCSIADLNFFFLSLGTISQWGEVSKKTKTTRPKTKDASSAPVNTELSSSARNTRGGRASDGAPRGGRGRATTDRGGRGGRARSTHPTNGSRPKDSQQLSVPTEESPAYKDDAANGIDDKKLVPAEKAAPVEPAKPAAPPVKTWASMLRQSIPPPKVVPAVPKEVPAPKPVEHVEPELVPEPALVEAEPVKPEAEEKAEATPVVEQATPVAAPATAEPVATIAPSQDELTETNLEQVVDVSQPPATDTAASTAADSWDPRQSPPSATATPLSAAQQQHQAQKTATSGFAASALKATTERVAPRTPSFQRRVLQQEEAVRMPGNREVDRAAVQFGAFNLDDDEDIDGEREEPETRAQPPADSPVAVPRTSLPPASQPVAVPEPYAPKTTTAPPPGMTPIGMCHAPLCAFFFLFIFLRLITNLAAAATSAQAPIPSQSMFCLQTPRHKEEYR